MKRLRVAAGITACVLLSGCFHQQFETGLAPSATVVTKPWHPSWFFGLVAGAPIDVRSQCPSGVAKVSTRMTFLNGLVAAFVGIIITPHEVTVTCASRAAVLPTDTQRSIGADATADEAAAVLNDAVKLAASSGAPVVLTFQPTAASAR
jgi:hypothetical protein